MLDFKKPPHVEIRFYGDRVYSYYLRRPIRGKAYRRPIVGDVGTASWWARYRKIHAGYEQQQQQQERAA